MGGGYLSQKLIKIKRQPSLTLRWLMRLTTQVKPVKPVLRYTGRLSPTPHSFSIPFLEGNVLLSYTFH